MTSARASLLFLLALILAAACASRPSEVRDEPIVMIKSVRLPERTWLPWYTRFAEHLWVDFFYAGIWHRVEWNDIDHILLQEISVQRAFADERWERAVAVHEVYRGAEGEEIAARILGIAKEYPCAAHYRAWPGPNSNTFIAWLARRVGMRTVLPPTAVGKDFTTWLHAGVTVSGTGIELETLPLGAEIGLCEGVEVHLFGLTAGVGLWPPAVKLPFLPAIPGGWLAP